MKAGGEHGEWWRSAAGRFELVASELVMNEAGSGDADAARDRLAALKSVTLLDATEEAPELATGLILPDFAGHRSSAEAGPERYAANPSSIAAFINLRFAASERHPQSNGVTSMSRTTLSGPISDMEHLSHLERLKKKLKLTCRRCGHAAAYDVGGIVVHPDAFRERDFDTVIEEYVCFSGYFRCEECDSAWPWDIPRPRLRTMLMFLIKRKLGIRTRGISFAIPAMSDGTLCRSPADGEDYLLERIAEDSGDFYLHNRLGNLYYHHGMVEQARASYDRAVKLNPRDAEAWCNLGLLHQQSGRDKAAIHGFQQTLRYAAHAEHLSPVDMRAFVREALEGLFELQYRNDGIVDFLPSFEPPPGVEQSYGGGFVRHEFDVDLDTEEGWERLTDVYLHEFPSEEFAGRGGPMRFERLDAPPDDSGRFDAPHNSFAHDPRIPRNRPCPCGSGRKFKNCCAKAVSR